MQRTTVLSGPGAPKDSLADLAVRSFVILFLVALLSYAFFFPGGGWNQNVRFAQIRSLVEAESIFIDDYLIYGRCGAESERRLCRWPCPEQPELMGLIATACSGDLALSGDHRHVVPNKPPGITLLGLLPYALLHGSERLGGLDPDAWWLLTVNAYVVTLCTVGLAAAGGVVVVSLLAARTFPDAAPRSWLLAAVGCGLGTIYFAYATMLYDHVVVAALVATQLLLTEELWPEAATRIPLQPWARWAWAGVAAGLAVACNYTALIPCGMIGLAMLGLSRDKPVTAAWFVAGGLPFALLLGAYQWAAFGSLVRLPHPAHADAGAATVAPMGGFVAPTLDVLVALLVSPHRGLFFTSPLLMPAVAGLAMAFRSPHTRRAAGVVTAVAIAVLMVNVCWKGWNGGSAIGPRYLLPAIPLLMVFAVPVFDRWPHAAALAVTAACIYALFLSCIDPQPLSAVAFPIRDYLWPLFTGQRLFSRDAVVEGPVSANPIGVYEGWFGRVFPCGSPETAWNSFNLGELCGLQGHPSLLPLLAVWAVGAAVLWRTGTRREPPRGSAQSKASGGIAVTSNCRGDGPAR
jgi:hypothetical protein